MNYINVIIDSKSHQIDLPFTYSCEDKLDVGTAVYVSFSMMKKEVLAYVVETDVKPNIDVDRIKPINEALPEKSLNEEMIETSLWMKRRYGVRFIDCIKSFTVQGKRPKEKFIKDVYDDYQDNSLNLNVEQEYAKKSICESVINREQIAFLVNGVTNSGKTEIYLAAIESALSSGRTAIMLVPEISLTKQTRERVSSRFGESAVAMIHSKLIGSEKLNEWQKLRDGRAKIAIGTRSAVFAPIENIGVIIIDEEHETTYKSDQNPKYETIDVAFKRAKYHGSTIIMGSATPSVVSTYRARQGIYRPLELKNRVDGGKMPTVYNVDMREEIKNGNFSPISTKLYNEIKKTIELGMQVILFLNRRGYSTSIQCKECGHKITCQECGVSMIYHKSENAMVCHYCGKRKPVPEICPDCGSKYIKYTGSGTEKVQEITQNLFKEANIERLDLDSAKRQSDVDKIITEFKRGKTDILIGTQILAKGLDFKNVGLVGVISADVSLNIPDFRSSERTFQLITQVAGRAGRGGNYGKVIVQTYTPDNYVIKAASEYDYETFYNTEINHRKTMKYPPFSDIVVVTLISEELTTAKENSEILYRKIKTFKPYKPKLGGRLNDRYHIMIKCDKGLRNELIRALTDYRRVMIENKIKCNMDIDVNPYGMV